MAKFRTPAILDAHRAMGEAACDWSEQVEHPSLYRYGFRHGVAHLLASDQDPCAEALLSDFGYGIARFKVENGPGARGVAQDAQAVQGRYGSTGFGWWSAFFTSKSHLLARGDAHWGAEKILLQLAVEHADNSPVTQAAEIWLGLGRCDWMWLRRARRPSEVHTSACLNVMAAHRESIDAAVRVDDHHLLTASADGTLRLWAIESGQCLRVYEGHSGPVVGLSMASNERFLSWSMDGTARLWALGGESSVAVFERVNGSEPAVVTPARSAERGCWGAVELQPGRFVTWWGDGASCLWEGERAEPKAELEPHKSRVLGVLHLDDGDEPCGGRVLSWSRGSLHAAAADDGEFYGELVGVRDVKRLPDNRALFLFGRGMCIYDTDTMSPIKALKAHPRGAVGAAILDDQIVSWSMDGSICVWSLDGALVGTAGDAAHPIKGAVPLPHGRLVTWSPSRGPGLRRVRGQRTGTSGSMDFGLKVWDLETGQLSHVLEGHTDRVWGAIPLPNERLLSWSWDTTLRVWDLQTGAALARLDGHKGEVQGASVLPDGRFLSWAEDGVLRLWRAQPEVGEGLEQHDHLVARAQLRGSDHVLSTDLWRGRQFMAPDHDERNPVSPTQHHLWCAKTGALVRRWPAVDFHPTLPSDVGPAAVGLERAGVRVEARGARLSLMRNGERWAMWHGDGLDHDASDHATLVDRARQWRAHDLGACGTVVASCNKEVAILHLHQGSGRVRIDALDRDSA